MIVTIHIHTVRWQIKDCARKVILATYIWNMKSACGHPPASKFFARRLLHTYVANNSDLLSTTTLSDITDFTFYMSQLDNLCWSVVGKASRLVSSHLAKDSPLSELK